MFNWQFFYLIAKPLVCVNLGSLTIGALQGDSGETPGYVMYCYANGVSAA